MTNSLILSGILCWIFGRTICRILSWYKSCSLVGSEDGLHVYVGSCVGSLVGSFEGADIGSGVGYFVASSVIIVGAV